MSHFEAVFVSFNTGFLLHSCSVGAPPSYESPSPPPAPQLPSYLPALMGCKNVESYEWLDRIEEGTYGVVYKAKDKRTGKPGSQYDTAIT